MVDKNVQVVRVQTLADGTIRLVLDILNGNSRDIAEAYSMITEETRMILAPNSAFSEAQQGEESHEDLP